MKKFVIFALLALLLVSAQCSFSITADPDVPTLVYSDSFTVNQGWNLQNTGDFTAFINNYELQLNIGSPATEGTLWAPLSNSYGLSNTYSIQVNSRVQFGGSATALILFNYIDSLNHDAFQIDQSGNWRLVRFTNGSPILNTNWRTNFSLDGAGYTNTIVISQHSNRIDLNFNGSGSDSVYLPSRSQTITVGLGIRGTGTVYYDNLYLTRLTY